MALRRGVVAMAAIVMLVSGLGTPVRAQAARTVSIEALDRDPSPLLHQPIRVARLGCFAAEGGGYRCTTYHGAYVVLDTVAPAAIKAKIDAGCGGIVESEDDPTCLFDVTFTPAAVSKGTGSIVKGDESVSGPVWMIRAASGAVAAHR